MSSGGFFFHANYQNGSRHTLCSSIFSRDPYCVETKVRNACWANKT